MMMKFLDDNNQERDDAVALKEVKVHRTMNEILVNMRFETYDYHTGRFELVFESPEEAQHFANTIIKEIA